VLTVIGNLTYQKFVSLPLLPVYSFELSVGAMVYPITFLITDLIVEFYGKDRAMFCVRLSILMNIITAGIIYGMNLMPAAQWSNVSDATFHKVFGFYSIAFTGSIIACYIAQFIDTRVYLWIKKITGGRHLWLRSNGSTALSILIDTSIVIFFLTAFSVVPKEQMLPLIINGYSFKLAFTICSTPLFYLCVAVIGAKKQNHL